MIKLDGEDDGFIGVRKPFTLDNFMYADELQPHRFSTPHTFGLTQAIFQNECDFADDYAQAAVEGRQCVTLFGAIDSNPSPFWRNNV